LVMDIYLAEQCYRNSCKALQVRNEKLKAFQSTIDIKHFDLDTGASGGIAHLPDLKLLRDATNAVFDCLDDALARQIGAMRKLRNHAKRIFPKDTFPIYELDDDANDKKSSNPTGERQG